MGTGMAIIVVELLEWGTNKYITKVMMDAHYPAVGEYIVDEAGLPTSEDWKEHMYIVRAVTHFRSNLVTAHAERYNPDVEDAKARSAAEYWAHVVDKLKREEKENVKKSEENK